MVRYFTAIEFEIAGSKTRIEIEKRQPVTGFLNMYVLMIHQV